jgi:hypothetical protein
MFLSQYFSFPLSVSFLHCSILIFIYTLLLPEVQTGKSWESSKITNFLPEIRHHQRTITHSLIRTAPVLARWSYSTMICFELSVFLWWWIGASVRSLTICCHMQANARNVGRSTRLLGLDHRPSHKVNRLLCALLNEYYCELVCNMACWHNHCWSLKP